MSEASGEERHKEEEDGGGEEVESTEPEAPPPLGLLPLPHHTHHPPLPSSQLHVGVLQSRGAMVGRALHLKRMRKMMKGSMMWKSR